MTATGPTRKQRCALFAALSAGLALALCAAAAFGAAAARPIVADPHSGLALYGFDPVSYFTEGQPAPGAPEFEYRFAGVSWRFRNDGNRAAFATNPEIYAPRFGGYDPLGVARGVATPGHPQVWVRNGDRIYLFQKEETRAAFIADPAKAIAAADGRWPQVASELVQ